MKEVLKGPGIKVRNIKYTGNPDAIAKFTNPDANPHFEEGVVISTGKARDMLGPNNAPKTSTVNARPGDKTLYSIANGRTFDAAELEFDFMADKDSVALNFFFASEEYNDYVGSSFNDAFLVQISGPGFRNGKNLALVPGTKVPINVNNVSFNKHRKYYKDNNPFTLSGRINPTRKAELDPQLLENFQFDGMTQVISAGIRVTPKEIYHVKIAIADAGDGTVDSAVLLEAKSFQSHEQYKWVRRRLEIAEKRRQDSLARVQAIQDSLAAIEQARMDSIAAVEQELREKEIREQEMREAELREQEEAREREAREARDEEGFELPDEGVETDEEGGGNVHEEKPFEDAVVSEERPAIKPVGTAPSENYHRPPGSGDMDEYKAVIIFEHESYIVPDSSAMLLGDIADFLVENPELRAGIYVPGGDNETTNLRFDMIRIELLKKGAKPDRIFKNGFSFVKPGVRLSRNRAEIWIRTGG